MADPHFTLEAAIEHLRRVQKLGGSRPMRLTIRKHNPGGMAGHGTTEVESIAAGFDWTAGQVIVYPAKPLTELTPEQVEAIEKSVRAGGSWHAYEAQKKMRERALKAEARVAELEQQIATRGVAAAPAPIERPCQGCGGTGLVDTSGFGDMATCEECRGRGTSGVSPSDAHTFGPSHADDPPKDG